MVAILVISCIICILFVKFLHGLIFKGCKDPRNSEIYKASWYGKDPASTLNEGGQEDTSIQPFKIEIPQEVIDDLKSRLQRTRFEDPVEDSKFHYGFNPKYLKTVVEYWRSQYDWRKHEAELNRFSHFKTRIEGINVHFVHAKPSLPEGSKLKVIPLMIIHGWPGSFVEFYKIIPLLTTPRRDCDFVFEVICPSIPGYGFSESPHRSGFNCKAAARVFVTLMERLGHRRFYVQGGDWGSYTASLMARYYPQSIRGLHVNMYLFLLEPWELLKGIFICLFPFLVRKEEYRTTFPLKKKIAILLRESGYFHMQATKPDTLGCAMADSPAGAVAYLLEKFGPSVGIDEGLNHEDGRTTAKFTLDELLTNVMMYWLNNNFTAAARFYKENFQDVFFGRNEKVPVTVPSGVAVFPNEVLMFPKAMMSQQMKNIVSYTIMPRGGHFAALEEPQLLADDICKFVAISERKEYKRL